MQSYAADIRQNASRTCSTKHTDVEVRDANTTSVLLGQVDCRASLLERVEGSFARLGAEVNIFENFG